MSKFLKRSAQGAGVPHEKRTAGLETVAMPLPSKIVLSMNQHIGAPAVPCVNVGDTVAKGDVIAKPAEGKLGACIHASISGTIKEIADGCIAIEK